MHDSCPAHQIEKTHKSHKYTILYPPKGLENQVDAGTRTGWRWYLQQTSTIINPNAKFLKSSKVSIISNCLNFWPHVLRTSKCVMFGPKKRGNHHRLRTPHSPDRHRDHSAGPPVADAPDAPDAPDAEARPWRWLCAEVSYPWSNSW